MNRRRPIRRPSKPRATKPEPLPTPDRAPTVQEMGAVMLRALSAQFPAYESGGHE